MTAAEIFQQENEKWVSDKVGSDSRQNPKWRQLIKPIAGKNIVQNLWSACRQNWWCGNYNAAAFFSTSFVNTFAPDQSFKYFDEFEQFLKLWGRKSEYETERAIRAGLFTGLHSPTLLKPAILLYCLLLQDLPKCKTERLISACSMFEMCGWSIEKRLSEIAQAFLDAAAFYGYASLKKAKEKKKNAAEILCSSPLEIMTQEYGELGSDAFYLMNDGDYTGIAAAAFARDHKRINKIGAGWLFYLQNDVFFHKTVLGASMLSSLVMGAAKFMPEKGQTTNFIQKRKYPFGFHELSEDASTDNPLEYRYLDHIPPNIDDTKKYNDEILCLNNTLLSGMNGDVCYPRIDTLISRLAHKTIDSSNLVISGKVRRYFELCGCSETKARDVALCVSVLRRVHDMESPYEQNSFFHDPQEIARQEGNDKSQNAEEQKPKDDAVEKQAESKTIQKLQLRIRELEREAQNARHELALLKKENAALQNHCNECSDLIDAYEKMAQEMNEQQTKEETDKNAFPYYTNKNIVLYGGFDCFLNEIKELLPDVKNIPNISHTIDPSPLRGADAIFVQLNHISHSAYYFLRDFTKRNKIPFYLLKNANAEICANIMVRQIEKLQQQEK